MAKNCEILVDQIRVDYSNDMSLMRGVKVLPGGRERDTTNEEYERIVARKREEVAFDGPLWRFNDFLLRKGHPDNPLDYDLGGITEFVEPTTYGTHAAFQGRTDVDVRYRGNPLSHNAVGVTADGYMTLSQRGIGADRPGRRAFIGIGFLKRYPDEVPEQVHTALLREIVEEMSFRQLDMDQALEDIGENGLITDRSTLERALAAGFSDWDIDTYLDGEQRETLAGYQRLIKDKIVDIEDVKFLGLIYDVENGDTTNACGVPFKVERKDISPANAETNKMKFLKATKRNLREFENRGYNCINHTYGDVELLLKHHDAMEIGK